jgi:hypothetical protein
MRREADTGSRGTMTMYKRVTAAALVVTILCAGVSGCTSMKPIMPATAPGLPAFGPVKAGDTVSLVANGRPHRFVVRSVDATNLTSMAGVRFERADVTQLKRRTTSRAKTTGLVLGLSVGAFLVFLAIAAGMAAGDALNPVR